MRWPYQIGRIFFDRTFSIEFFLLRHALRALLIEAAKSPFSNPLLNWDCSYSDQCSLLSKTAFVQIGPQTCNQVQKRGGSGSGRFFQEPWNPTYKKQQGSSTYTLSPRKTRIDTHHSRALDSPLDLAHIHMTVFV